MAIYKGSGKVRPHGCTCDFNFTCGVCLKVAADRNLAEQNLAPLAWTQPPKTNQKKEENSLDFQNWLG